MWGMAKRRNERAEKGEMREGCLREQAREQMQERGEVLDGFYIERKERRRREERRSIEARKKEIGIDERGKEIQERKERREKKTERRTEGKRERKIQREKRTKRKRQRKKSKEREKEKQREREREEKREKDREKESHIWLLSLSPSTQFSLPPKLFRTISITTFTLCASAFTVRSRYTWVNGKMSFESFLGRSQSHHHHQHRQRERERNAKNEMRKEVIVLAENGRKQGQERRNSKIVENVYAPSGWPRFEVRPAF
ncbi:RNA-binding protein 25-like [Leptopilina heterotoma]|uniref:RNA-binding protein 25-like n=1 Tax=Leptopilina heterotoma TaxID=63436 RepID=UPI001CA9554B|nr:RNA-binding protein 25-like [Leptopilina heterotoma]